MLSNRGTVFSEVTKGVTAPDEDNRVGDNSPIFAGFFNFKEEAQRPQE